jgi:CYTH domain-containing protein
MKQLELEKTYLARYLPEKLWEYEHKDLLDIYVPESAEHPTLRIRRRGDKYEITKKTPVENADASQHVEHTIVLEQAEFAALAQVKGKKVHKTRYGYSYQNYMAEIDVFKDELAGLVLVDFEFETIEEMEAFKMPDFCLVDVTQEVAFAGGMLCGKKYADVEKRLSELGYKKLHNNLD